MYICFFVSLLVFVFGVLIFWALSSGILGLCFVFGVFEFCFFRLGRWAVGFGFGFDVGFRGWF